LPWREDEPRFFPAAPPRPVQGGIRADSRRGAFARSWWARRWIAALEGLQLGGRLARGRAYARRGQVIEIAVSPGEVSARVQGSRKEPYAIALRMPVFSSAEARRLLGVLRREARFAARLLAGEMPHDVEQAFSAASLSLFPRHSRELTSECSCPDWSNPCKHIAAVYYLLGEEFDRDTFLLLRLRGLEREDLLRQLGGAPSARPLRDDKGASGTAPERRRPPAERARRRPKLERLPADPDTFWGAGELPALPAAEAVAPVMHAAAVRRLGGFPFWRGRQRLVDALEPVYARASARALELLAGTRPAPGRR
jgi:uncharacterized Zn finger protein